MEVVQPAEASQMITQFLGGSFGPITTPPLDAYGDTLALSAPTTTSTSTATGVTACGTVHPEGRHRNRSARAATVPSYDPRPC